MSIGTKVALNRVRALSFDVTGTLLVHRHPIFETYAAAAVWARLNDPPTAIELKTGFKQAYKSTLLSDPNFGLKSGSEREWWIKCVKAALLNTGRTYSEEDFDRYQDIIPK